MSLDNVVEDIRDEARARAEEIREQGEHRAEEIIETAETDADEPVVESLRAALRADGRDDEPVGATYGADSRHYVEAGVPTVLFGPGDIDQAHFPDETVEWAEVEVARDVIRETAARFLQSR